MSFGFFGPIYTSFDEAIQDIDGILRNVEGVNVGPWTEKNVKNTNNLCHTVVASFPNTDGLYITLFISKNDTIVVNIIEINVIPICSINNIVEMTLDDLEYNGNTFKIGPSENPTVHLHEYFRIYLNYANEQDSSSDDE